MSSSSSILPSDSVRHTVCPVWAAELGGYPCGLALAREKGWFLVSDEKGFLQLFNRAGTRQARTKIAGKTAAVCAAEDGSAFVAVDARGDISWLAPDLTVRWKRSLAHPALSAALDAYGQYLAVGDSRGNLHYLDRYGRPLCQVQSPRPLCHLAFVPTAPLLIGCAEYGLVACHDMSGRCLWRDGLVVHVGSLAVSGDGKEVALACFSAGLQRYTSAGANQGRLPLAEPCRMVAMSFDGRFLLAAGLSNRLFLLDCTGRILCAPTFEKPIVSLGLAALAESAVIALADGQLVGLELAEATP